jgi:hypothetical protein
VPVCAANQPLAHHRPLETALRVATAGLVQFGRIEVGETDFDPRAGLACRTDAQSVAIADIADDATEDSALGRKRSFARIGVSW